MQGAARLDRRPADLDARETTVQVPCQRSKGKLRMNSGLSAVRQLHFAPSF